MDDVGVVESSWDGQLFEFTTCWGRDFDEQTIDRIVDQGIVVDLWTDAIVIGCEGTFSLEADIAKEGLFETIWRGAHGRIG